jgi:hypothetical protein
MLARGLPVPEGFWLELAFWYRDSRPRVVKLHDFLRSAVKLGVQILGGDDLNTGEVIHFKNDEMESVIQSSTYDFWHFFVATPMNLVPANKWEIIEEITLPWLEYIVDTPPIEVISEAEVFHESDSPSDITPRMDEAGRKVVDFFIALAEETRPAYGAILIGEMLETPTQLKQHKGSAAFVDFYISRSYVGEANFNHILQIYEGGYIRELTDGAYISSGPFFNPEHIWLPLRLEGSQRTDEVAQIIASVAKEA